MSRGHGKVQKAILDRLTEHGGSVELRTLALFVYMPGLFEEADGTMNLHSEPCRDMTPTKAQTNSTARAVRLLAKAGKLAVRRHRDSFGEVKYAWITVSVVS